MTAAAPAPAPQGIRAGRGSWPVLLVLSAAFVLLFYWQRGRSTFLRIEQERPTARELAERAQIPIADVLALRDLIGPQAPEARWLQVVRDYGASLREVVWARAPADYPPVGAAALQVENWPANPVRLAIHEVTNDTLARRRFLLMRERFAARR